MPGASLVLTLCTKHTHTHTHNRCTGLLTKPSSTTETLSQARARQLKYSQLVDSHCFYKAGMGCSQFLHVFICRISFTAFSDLGKTPHLLLVDISIMDMT